MRYDTAKQFLAVRRGTIRRELYGDRQAEGQQLSVNRESATLFAMKYAIGEILFFGVRFRMTLAPGTSMARATAESPSEVSHEVCDWQKLFSRPLLRCARAMGSEAVPATRSFPRP